MTTPRSRLLRRLIEVDDPGCTTIDRHRHLSAIRTERRQQADLRSGKRERHRVGLPRRWCRRRVERVAVSANRRRVALLCAPRPENFGVPELSSDTDT